MQINITYKRKETYREQYKYIIMYINRSITHRARTMMEYVYMGAGIYSLRVAATLMMTTTMVPYCFHTNSKINIYVHTENVLVH